MKHVLFLLLVSGVLFSEEVWRGEFEEGITLVIHRSTPRVAVDGTLEIAIEAHMPKGYRLNKEDLKHHLMRYGGAGISPFLFVSAVEEGNRITFHLDPEIPGVYPLTFRDVEIERGEGKLPLRLLTGVFDVHVTALPLQEELEKKEEASPFGPLFLSPYLPIVPDRKVKEKFLDNKEWLFSKRQEDLKKIARSHFPWRFFSFLMGGMLILLGVGGLIAFRRLQKGRKAPILFSARRRALAELEELEALHLPEEGRFREFYERLSALVKRYLEERYDMPAETMTTEEFLLYAKAIDVQERVASLLEQADAVKFAHHKADRADCEEAKKAAIEII